MTNTEWLCLRLATKIEERAAEAAKHDRMKLEHAGGHQITQQERDRFERQRKEAHKEALMSFAAMIMEDVVGRVFSKMSADAEKGRAAAAKLAQGEGK